MAEADRLRSFRAFFGEPTFGLEPGGSYDRSVGQGMIRDMSHVPAGSEQSPADLRRIQAQQTTAAGNLPMAQQPGPQASPEEIAKALQYYRAMMNITNAAGSIGGQGAQAVYNDILNKRQY